MRLWAFTGSYRVLSGLMVKGHDGFFRTCKLHSVAGVCLNPKPAESPKCCVNVLPALCECECPKAGSRILNRKLGAQSG